MNYVVLAAVLIGAAVPAHAADTVWDEARCYDPVYREGVASNFTVDECLNNVRWINNHFERIDAFERKYGPQLVVPYRRQPDITIEIRRVK